MIRILTPLGAFLLLGLPADAQVIRANRPQPAGVVPRLKLPVANPASARPAPPMERYRQRAFPNYGLFGFGEYYSYPFLPADDYAPPPTTMVNDYVPVPVPTPVVPPPPVELRARLTLAVPTNATVWLAGEPVDVAVLPVILESPVLRPGQTYTFDVKVAWREGDKTEERTRTVTIEAGHGASVTYFGGK